jgi:hypothetical protein
MTEVIRQFCDAVEKEGITIRHPRTERGRQRKARLDPDAKARFLRLAKATPVSRELLIREAIYRFIGAC